MPMLHSFFVERVLRSIGRKHAISYLHDMEKCQRVDLIAQGTKEKPSHEVLVDATTKDRRAAVQEYPSSHPQSRVDPSEWSNDRPSDVQEAQPTRCQTQK